MRKKTLLVIVTICMLSVSSVFANGLSLNSIGTRAIGMGGAFVGLANDASAIYWNPAGLSGQNCGVSLFMTDVIPFATYKMDMAGIDATAKTNHYISPNIFAVHSMDKLTFGLGLYVPAGLGAEWEKDDFGAEMMSKIGVFNISPAVAYQLSDKFSIGATLNIFYGMMEMKRGEGMAQYSEDISGTGFGASFGLKYNASEKLSFGLSYKTPLTVGFEGDADMGMDIEIKRDIEWPTWIGIGAAYAISDKWTVTLDGQWSDWASSEDVMITEMTGAFGGPGTSITMSDTTEMNWESALQIRVGTEYLLSESVTIRAGYYYDPAPAPDQTVNILFPSSTNHALSGGFGYTMDKLIFDLSFEYLLGAERDIEVNATNEMPGIHQMDVFAFSFGVGYKF